MCDDDGGRPAGNRFPEYFPRLHGRGVEGADGDDGRADHAVFCVQQHNAEMLGRPRAERGQEVRRGVVRREELRPLVGRGRQRPPAQFERRQELRGLRRPDPRYRREIVAPERATP